MSEDPEIKKLAELFRKLGANDPEAWARSQVHEGIPQLARFLFLRQAWRNIASEDDSSWIDQAIAEAVETPDAPYAGVGHALLALRAREATDDEITDLVRGMQAKLLVRLCQLLEDPGEVEPEAGDVGWVLVQVDKQGNPVDAIGGLHESVLETDPTGRQMRPRDESR